MRKRYEFELYDVFEKLNKKNLEKNIKYILRRERLWKRGWRIVFPAGALEIEEEVDGDVFFQYDFEIFAADHNTILYYGTVYGTADASTKEIKWMQVELKEASPWAEVME
jgi:hypothetical protein